MCFSPFPYKVLGVFTMRPTTFFIDVLPWHEQQKALETLLYQCCVPFIDRKCKWHCKESMLPLSQDKLSLQVRVCLGLEFYGVYLPYLWLICDWCRVPFLVVAFPPCGHLFWAVDLGPCPLFLFLSLSWALSFYKVWQGFIRKDWNRNEYDKEWIKKKIQYGKREKMRGLIWECERKYQQGKMV